MATADLESAVSNVRLQELLADHPVDISRMLHGLCTAGFLLSDKRRRWTTYRLGGPRHVDRGTYSSPWTSDSSPSLAALAAPVAGTGKATTEVVRRTIIEVCTGRHLSADDLGQLLRRNPARLRSRYLTPMVREGLLRLRFPDAPNRPDQAYVTTEREPRR